MTAKELREKYIKFFEDKKHARITPARLVTDDQTTLFTSSGMQPLIPYLMGETHPSGVRLVDSQPCFRAEDIEEVGDNRHTTFFEMLGNWSLGNYFKKDQIQWFYQFLTDKEKGVGLPPEKLYITVFGGEEGFSVNGKLNQLAPDIESLSFWKEEFRKDGMEATVANNDNEQQDIKKGRIFYYGVEKNWWSRSGTPKQMPLGEIGGPDSEVFYDFGEERKLHEKSIYKDKPCHPNCDCGRFLEIGNSVFIQYKKIGDSELEELSQKNVDFGGGLERLVAAKGNNPNILEIDLFKPIVLAIVSQYFQGIINEDSLFEADYLPTPKVIYENDRDQEQERVNVTSSVRIIADHIRAGVFLIKDGIEPSNKLQGYVLRRLLRRAATKLKPLLSLTDEKTLATSMQKISQSVVISYGKEVFDIERDKEFIGAVIFNEIMKFSTTLDKGLREIEKLESIDGKTAFNLYQTYGFPLEILEEIFKEKGKNINNREDFTEELLKHQEQSRTASAGMFKGGLGDHSDVTVRGHTATHLLHQALRDVLGDSVHQTGSNINPERIRFDFSYGEKLSPEQIKGVEEIVNSKISADLQVKRELLNRDEADKKGAIGLFKEKYADKVSIYEIGDYSIEYCGGPHVNHTAEVGKFKIIKEESVSAGQRRIKAVLE